MTALHNSVGDVMNLLHSHVNEEYAQKMKAYLKDKFELLGVKAPRRKELIKPFIKYHKTTDYKEIRKMVKELWKMPVRDGQYVAMDLYSSHVKKIEREDLDLLEFLITTKSWWDTVDWVATHAVGRYFEKYDDVKMTTIGKWMETDNIWLKRSAIIHQLFYKERTDADLLATLIIDQKGSKEFFINKACGWALRQYSKTNPSWVELFIDEHAADLSNLTIKEGLKWIEKNK